MAGPPSHYYFENICVAPLLDLIGLLLVLIVLLPLPVLPVLLLFLLSVAIQVFTLSLVYLFIVALTLSRPLSFSFFVVFLRVFQGAVLKQALDPSYDIT